MLRRDTPAPMLYSQRDTYGPLHHSGSIPAVGSCDVEHLSMHSGLGTGGYTTPDSRSDCAAVGAPSHTYGLLCFKAPLFLDRRTWPPYKRLPQQHLLHDILSHDAAAVPARHGDVLDLRDASAAASRAASNGPNPTIGADSHHVSCKRACSGRAESPPHSHQIARLSSSPMNELPELGSAVSGDAMEPSPTDVLSSPPSPQNSPFGSPLTMSQQSLSNSRSSSFTQRFRARKHRRQGPTPARPCSRAMDAAPYATRPPPQDNTQRMSSTEEMLLLDASCPPELASESLWRLQDFLISRPAGEGVHDDENRNASDGGVRGGVVQARWRRATGPGVTLKIYSDPDFTAAREKDARREVETFSTLDHPHVMKLWGAFKGPGHVVLVLEPGVQLKQTLRATKARSNDEDADASEREHRMDERELVNSVLEPCLRGLSYLHRAGVVHGDLHVGSLFRTADGAPKVGPSSLCAKDGGELPTRRPASFDCMSPELLCYRMAEGARAAGAYHGGDSNDDGLCKLYNAKLDVWAAGVLAFKLLTSRAPFSEPTLDATIRAVLAKDVPVPEGVSPLAAGFLRAALTKEAATRPSVDALLAHDWITSHTVHHGGQDVTAPIVSRRC